MSFPSLIRRFVQIPSIITLALAALPGTWAGHPLPPEPEPTLISEEAYHVPVPRYRNPRNRFGAQGGLIFGVRAEFVSEAFTGNDITVLPGDAPENVIVDRGRGSADENGGLGGELFYERILGESDLVADGVDEVWGIHIGFGFNELEFSDTSAVNSFRRLNGAAGPFLSQGSMRHDLEADLWHVNVGLFKESHLTDRFYAKVGGGLSVAYIDAEYAIRGPFDFVPEYAEETDFLFGGYIDLTLGYDLSRHWALYTGIRYQYLTPFEMDVANSETEVKFDQSFMAFLGVRFSF